MSFSDRFSACYLQSVPSETVIRLLTDLASATGMSLTFPGTESVALLSDYGEQSLVSMAEFMQSITNLPVVRFQFWWCDSEDLYCRVERAGSLVSLEFALDGNSAAQEQKMWESLKQQFDSLAQQSVALALILDRTGRTSEYPWKEIAVGQTQLTAPYPDEMIFPTTSKCLESADPAYARTLELTPYSVVIKSK